MPLHIPSSRQDSNLDSSDERSRRRRASTRQTAPRDPFVWYLFRYLSIKLLLLYLRCSCASAPVLSSTGAPPPLLHKAWKFFKLGPLIISCPGGHITFIVSRSLPLYLLLFLDEKPEARLSAFGNIWHATNLPRESSPSDTSGQWYCWGWSGLNDLLLASSQDREPRFGLPSDRSADARPNVKRPRGQSLDSALDASMRQPRA